MSHLRRLALEHQDRLLICDCGFPTELRARTASFKWQVSPLLLYSLPWHRARTEPLRKVSCQSAHCRATLFGGSREKCFAFRSRSVDGTEYVTHGFLQTYIHTPLLSTAPSGMAVHSEHAWLGVWTEHTRPSPRSRQPEAGRKVAPRWKNYAGWKSCRRRESTDAVSTEPSSKQIRSPKRSSFFLSYMSVIVYKASLAICGLYALEGNPHLGAICVIIATLQYTRCDALGPAAYLSRGRSAFWHSTMGESPEA